MKKIEAFRAGELMSIASGEYSGYCVDGLFRVLVDFDAQELLLEWAKEIGGEVDADGLVPPVSGDKNITFLGWLNKNNYIEDVDYRTLHIGSFGDTKLTEERLRR